MRVSDQILKAHERNTISYLPKAIYANQRSKADASRPPSSGKLGHYDGPVKMIKVDDVKPDQHIVVSNQLYKVSRVRTGRNRGDREIVARPVARPNNTVFFQYPLGSPAVAVATP